MKPEVKKIIGSFIPGALFVGLLSLLKYYEVSQHISFSSFGVFPRTLDGLTGILTFPFIHKDYDHLFSNAVPLFVLMAMLSYFYQEMAVRTFIYLWLLGGIWLWMGGRPSFHIGASGLVYGLASFIFFSGLWRKWRSMLAVSMIVVFLYGGMIWGIFPWFKDTSWEGHLFGGMAGLLLSWMYRKEGPQRPKYVWEDEMEDDKMYDEEGNEIDLSSGETDLPSSEASLKMEEDVPKTEPMPQISYTYVEKNPSLNQPSPELRQDDTDETDKIG